MFNTSSLRALLVAAQGELTQGELSDASRLVTSVHKALQGQGSVRFAPRQHAALQRLLGRLLIDTAAFQRRARRRGDAEACFHAAEFAHEVDLVGCKLFAMARGAQ